MYIYTQYYQKEIFTTKVDSFKTAVKDNLIKEIFEELSTNINDYQKSDYLSEDSKDELNKLHELYYNFENVLAEIPENNYFVFYLKDDVTYIDFSILKQENNHFKADIVIDSEISEYWTAKIEWFE